MDVDKDAGNFRKSKSVHRARRIENPIWPVLLFFIGQCVS